ncbi:Gypsy retrotransposon integrase-like protein 1 [Vitis vinifera]|uniref:Gypsy retrotransposon integrase-like protein 1 n=1 Tax=Vitis vinifera TaxID=29760 RepID=A0A438DQ16_VITVI|nr:Gypsy retrotransposon integrase-like protein 1 [Vitis vinifera]
MRWLVLLTEFDIHYVTQKSIRGSIVADHLASLPVSDARAIDDDFPDEDVAAVTSLSVRLAFSDRHPATNNIVEYEACILGLETALELGIRQMEVFGDSNLVLRQIQGEWKTRDVKLKPYHAYLELLVGRFDDLRYTHLPRAQNQFADALATLASMIDIPVDATVRPFDRVEICSCLLLLIDDVEPDDGLPWYHDIYHFLRLGVYPEAATAKDKRALRQLATRFVICGETLYRRSPDGMLLLCLDRASADRVMREVHAGVCGPHMGGHMLARKIMRTGYFWLTMETDCCQFVQRCPECQIHGDLIHVPPSELHALTSPWPFSVWGIDIIGKISPKSSSGHEFILVAIDYFTKWVEAASYARLTSSGVASFIRSHIICRYGVPHELISDRGVHFRAEVDTLVQRYSIRHHRSSAYRPQTNGAVEAANKNIKRILRRMVETSRDWSEKLPFALWAYRTSFRTSTGATPYSLVYGMEAMLPVEIEMGSLRVALEQQIPEADWAQARFDQLNLLDERRLRAADHVRAYQRKMARAFKKRGVDPRGRCMVDGFRWKPILRANQCGSAKEVLCLRPWSQDGWPSFRDPSRFDALRIIITHITISSLFHLSPYRYHIHVRHPQVHGSWGSLYMLHFIYEGMSFDHWVFEPSFLSFLSPYHLGLRYVPCLKTTLRPWDQMSSSAASTWTGLIQLCSDYQDPLRSTQPVRTSRHLDAIMPLHLGGTSWICVHDSVMDSDDHCYMMTDDFCRSISDLSCIRCPYWGIFSVSDEIYGLSWVTCAMMDDFMTFVLRTCRAPDAILGHIPFRRIFMDLRRARFIPFDIVVIPGWSCLWCLDFPRHHFRGVHIRSVTRPIGVILRSSGQIGGASFETRRVPFSHFQRIEICSGMSTLGASPTLVCLGHPPILLCLGRPPAFSSFRASPIVTLFRASPYFRVSLDVQGHILSFGVQSHHHFLSLTFRAAFPVPGFRAIIIVSQFRRLEPLLLRLTFRVSHHRFSILAFKAIVASQFWRSEPSLFSVWHSEPLSLFSLAFRIIIAFQFWRSEPLSLLSFGVQSHHYFQFGIQSLYRFSVWRSESSSLPQFGVQSHHYFQFGIQSLYRFLVSAFRAIIVAFQFGVQSRHRFLDRHSESHSQFRRSEPSPCLQYGIQSHQHFFSFGVRSHHRFSDRRSESLSLLGLTFRVIIITSQFRRSEPSSVFRSAFRVIIITSQFRHSKPSSIFRSTFRVASSVSAFEVVITSQLDV